MATPDSKRKALYKCGSPHVWRDNYKKRCKTRLKESRSKVLDKYRNFNNITETKYLEMVMSEEWEKLSPDQSLMEANVNPDYVLCLMEEIKKELLEWEAENIFEHDINADIKQFDSTVDDNSILCPICNDKYLDIKADQVTCLCGICIDTEQDSMSVNYVRKSLEEGVSSHISQCSSRPMFSVVQNFGSSNLLLTCAMCDYMFIVV